MSGRVTTVHEPHSPREHITVRVPGPDPAFVLPKIFVWVNAGGRAFRDDVLGAALAEDGSWLTDHLSSNRSFFRLDMGLLSERKHDIYAAHYPDGYELVEVPAGEETTHVGLRSAYERYEEQIQVGGPG